MLVFFPFFTVFQTRSQVPHIDRLNRRRVERTETRSALFLFVLVHHLSVPTHWVLFQDAEFNQKWRYRPYPGYVGLLAKCHWSVFSLLRFSSVCRSAKKRSFLFIAAYFRWLEKDCSHPAARHIRPPELKLSTVRDSSRRCPLGNWISIDWLTVLYSI